MFWKLRYLTFTSFLSFFFNENVLMNLVLAPKFHQVSDGQTVSRHHLDEEWPTFCLRIRTEVMKKYVKTLELTGE